MSVPRPIDSNASLEPSLGLGRVGDECPAVCAGHFLGRDAENAHGRAIGPNEPRIEALVHVGDRGFVEQVAQPLLTLRQCLTGLLSQLFVRETVVERDGHGARHLVEQGAR